LLILRVSKLILSTSNDDFTSSNHGLYILFIMLFIVLAKKISDTYSDRVLFKLLLLFVSCTCGSTFFGLEFLDRLADDFHEVLLQRFFFKDETVLVPDEIGHLGIPAVLLHASLKQPKHKLVIRVLGEL
jgi:hypothetical protein